MNLVVKSKASAAAVFVAAVLLPFLPRVTTAQEGQGPSPADMARRLLLPGPIVEQLGLSDEQKGKLDKLVADLADKHKQELQDARDQLMKLWPAMQEAREKQDRDAMDKLREQNRQIMNALQGLRTDFTPQFLALLTDEQRQKVEKIRAQAGGGGSPTSQSSSRPSIQEPPPKVDTSSFKPIEELGEAEYKGFKGGLYPDGKNQRPAAHEAMGVALAKKVQPLNSDGQPAAGGKIVLLTIGMSNTTMESQAFKSIADADPQKNPGVAIVDGAVGGQTAVRIQNTEGNGGAYWATVDNRLKAADATRAQVQAAWLKEADAHPTDAFPKHAQTLQAEEAKIVQLMAKRFPNLKLVYLSNRTFGGYAKTQLNPEPFAYETGFAVKWLIEQQIKGDASLNCDPSKGAVMAPWLSWGPDLWANGMTKRADGLFYEEKDFVDRDRTHPSDFGRKKVAELLLKFFKTDTTTRGWFVKQ